MYTSAEMPFAASITRDHAAAIAFAVAANELCEQAAEKLDTFPVAAMLAPGQRRLRGLALALLDIGEYRREERDGYLLRVTASCTSPLFDHIPGSMEDSTAFDHVFAAIKEQSRHTQRLESYAQIVEARAQLTAEALSLGKAATAAIARAAATAGTNNPSPAVAPQSPRIIHLANALEALQLFESCLPLLLGNANGEPSLLVWAQPQTVIQRMERAVVLDRSAPYLWLALGEALLQEQRRQPALEALNTAVELAPDSARARHARGLLHLMANSATLAEQDLNAALRLDPDQAIYWHSRSMLHNKLGDYDSMCADMRTACHLGLCDGFDQARGHGYCLSN